MPKTKVRKKAKKPTEAELKAQARMELGELIPEDQVHDPAVYPPAVRRIRQFMYQGLIPTLDGDRLITGLEKACLQETRVPFAQAASLNQDPLLNLTPLMEQSDHHLTELEQAIIDLDEMRLTMGVKKKWMRLIRRVRIVRRRARTDAAVYWLYVGKDDDPFRAGKMIKYAPCHVRMFAIWNDDDYPHSLIEAPVGHGKSTCMRGQMTWEMGDCPELRHLYMTESKTLASRTLKSVRKIVKSGRFRAIFPEVNVLDRKQDAEDNAEAFTIGRKNEFAKDPTLIAVGYRGAIQGSRFDRIWPDDICPADVKSQPGIRAIVWEKWSDIVRTRVADPKYTRIRMIGTPWDPQDVLGKTVDAIKKGDLTGWRVEIDKFRIKIGPDNMPIPIWPEKFDAEWLQGQRNSLDSWPFTYELRFGDAAARTLSRVYFYNSRPSLVDPPGDQKYVDYLDTCERWLSIDPAGGGQTYSSGQGVVEFIITPNGDVFIPDCYFFRCGIMELLDELVKLIYDPSLPGKTRYHGTLWEVQASVKVAFPALDYRFKQMLAEKGIDKMRLVQTGTRMGGTGQNLGKKARWENAAPYFGSSAVRLAGQRIHKGDGTKFCGMIPGSRVARLAEILVNWDGEKRDSDAIDAASQWVLLNMTRIKSPTAPPPPVLKSVQPDKKFSAAHDLRHQMMMESLDRLIRKDSVDAEHEFLEQVAEKRYAGVA